MRNVLIKAHYDQVGIQMKQVYDSFMAPYLLTHTVLKEATQGSVSGYCSFQLIFFSLMATHTLTDSCVRKQIRGGTVVQ